MASYGLKATVTAVLNDDDYDIGVTYSDSDGFSFDKRLTGDLDSIEQDVTAAILEVYLDLLKQSKEKEKLLLHFLLLVSLLIALLLQRIL